MSSATHFYAMVEGPSHAVAVGPLPDYDRAGTWVFPHQGWTYRDPIALFSSQAMARHVRKGTVSEHIHDHNGQYDADAAQPQPPGATPPRSAGYLYVCAYLVPELIAELFAEVEGERS